MGLNERFLENEQNISALKIHRTGISVLLLICMWISLLDCGTVRIMDVKMAAYEMKAMPSAVEAEKGILTAGRCYPAWEKMKDSMVTDNTAGCQSDFGDCRSRNRKERDRKIRQ